MKCKRPYAIVFRVKIVVLQVCAFLLLHCVYSICNDQTSPNFTTSGISDGKDIARLWQKENWKNSTFCANLQRKDGLLKMQALQSIRWVKEWQRRVLNQKDHISKTLSDYNYYYLCAIYPRLLYIYSDQTKFLF